MHTICQQVWVVRACEFTCVLCACVCLCVRCVCLCVSDVLVWGVSMIMCARCVCLCVVCVQDVSVIVQGMRYEV